MSIGQKDYDKYHHAERNISRDDPHALEKLECKLKLLESEIPKNAGRISQVKKRIAQLRRIDRMAHEERGFPGGWFRTNEDVNRIQFLFGFPPDGETVKELEQLGFHQQTAYLWQSPRTPKYLRRAHKFLERLLEPYAALDLRWIPKLRMAKLLFYLRTIQEALGPAGSGKGDVEWALDAPPARNQAQTVSTDLEAIKNHIGGIPGVTMTIKGEKTSAPVVWITGDAEPHKEAIMAIGGRWSAKRTAWYIKPGKIQKSQ